MIKIIAFDPGVTTGYAMGTINDSGPMYVVTGQDRFEHADIWKLCLDFEPSFIIYERFDARHTRFRQGVELYSRELIGVLEMYKQTHLECETILQQPMKGGFFNDERLKKDAIHKSGKGHANDAARHLLYWYWFGSGGQFNSRTRGYKTGVI